MSQKPVIMEQLKQILQLKNDGIAIREIARRTGLSRNSVRYILPLKQGMVLNRYPIRRLQIRLIAVI